MENPYMQDIHLKKKENIGAWKLKSSITVIMNQLYLYN